MSPPFGLRLLTGNYSRHHKKCAFIFYRMTIGKCFQDRKEDEERKGVQFD